MSESTNDKPPQNTHTQQNLISRKPSETTDVYWIGVKRKIGDYPEHTADGGKWMIFVHIEQVDDLWNQVKAVTKAGDLGGMSKVATARPKQQATNPDEKVICVYTYDWQDEEDVRRIRQALRELGITHKIRYKTDTDTRAGKYSATGSKNLTKYYE